MPFQFNPFTDKLDLVGETAPVAGFVQTLSGGFDNLPVTPDGSGNIALRNSNSNGGIPPLKISQSIFSNSIDFYINGEGLGWVLALPSPSGALLFANIGYIVQTTLVGNTAYSLPAENSFGLQAGAIIEICYASSGTFSIAQAVGQQIIFGTKATTVGITGSLSSTFSGDCIRMVCIQVNPSIWMVTSSVGNFTIV